jgi:4-hydroxybenzoate polyprenyltransferase/phosphoserine phosphatase
MDIKTSDTRIPLVIDLDGTLIKGDLLWDTLFQLLREKPWCLFLLPFWLIGGKCRFKEEIARRVAFDASRIAYRPAVIERIRAEKAKGRPIVLATGSVRRFADAIAAHLGLFDKVEASADGVNLTSHHKAALLRQSYGEAGFDYIGNSRADVAIFDIARQSVVVAPDRAARQWHAEHGGELLDAGTQATWKSLVRMLRPHQWLKNALIFVPMVLDQRWFEPGVVGPAVIAFIAFSLAASSIYILNDLFDMSMDRGHPVKCKRPFASGELSPAFGFATMAVLLTGAFGAALLLPWEFVLVLVAYIGMTTAYSISVKRMLLLDVFTLAGLYATRIFAGTAATGIQVSFWLLAFSIFFFLSLALVKRYVELRRSTLGVGERIAGRGYRNEDEPIIAQAGVSSGFAAALVLALYLDSPAVYENYPSNHLLWALPPIVLYIILRIWILGRRDQMDEDPVVFIITDWRSQLFVAIGAALILAASMPW